MFINPKETLSACNIQATDTVADFGAGTGFIAFYVAQNLVPAGNVFAIEIQRDMVTRISRDAEEKKLTNIHALWGDVELNGGSQLKDKSADFVILANVLFQLDDKDAVLKETKRVLKDRGRILIIDWQESFGGMGPAPHHVFDESTAEAVVTKNGFKILNSKLPVGEHHYAILAEVQYE